MAKVSSPKGLETRNSIIKASKKLFYHNGYKKTSVSEICNECGISLGNLTYYFKTKQLIVSAIYQDLFMRSQAFVNSNCPEAYKMNSYEKNVHNALIYFKGILFDENTRRFHKEILNNESPGDYMSGAVEKIFRKFAADFNLRFSEREFEDMIDADNGISREIIGKYLDSDGSRDVAEVVTVLYVFRGRLFTINESLTRDYINEAIEFEKNNDHSFIKLLI